MEKQLNRDALKARCDELGLSQSDVATKLELTRAAVSKWFTGKSFPRPGELLKLGRLLGLRHQELVDRADAVQEPLVAFRRRGNCKTTDRHLLKARDTGNLLRSLVPYLDFDAFVGPPSLKNPSTDYGYLQGLVAKLRREIDVAEDAPVEFEKLIGFFHRYQAVVIPTLWGRKVTHENALHLHLPDTQTTWIYLNLDVEVHDFKFWMVHELGHVLTIDLLREGRLSEAEDFSDAFAGAFLFPEPVAEVAFTAYSRQRTERSRIDLLCEWAGKHVISPNSVYREIQNFAEEHARPFVEVEKGALHSAITGFNNRYPSLADYLFDGDQPSADHFMRVAQENFGTDFFKAFAAYVREKRPSPGGIAGILRVNPMDARAYYDALTQ